MMEAAMRKKTAGAGDPLLSVVSERFSNLADILSSITCYDREDFIHTAYVDVVESIKGGASLDESLALVEKKLRNMVYENGNGRKRHLSLDEHGFLLPPILPVEEELLSEDADPFEEHINEVIRDRVKKLKTLEREVVKLRFGLFGSPSLTVRETADLLGISQVKVRKLQRKALMSLKKSLYPYFPFEE